MKDEFPVKVKKKRFAWALNESKYLMLHEVRRLRKTCRKTRNQALEQNKTIAVRDWFMVELGLNTGLRVEEMRELKCEDLHIQEDRSSLSVRKGKGNKPRAVHINEEFKNTCKWFLKWKQKHGQGIQREDYLFTSLNGNHLCKRTLQKAFKRCVLLAGLDSYYSIHCLRHTYGSHLYLASKHNLRLVQEQLGHSSVRITEVYASLMNSDAKKAVERLYKGGE